MPMRRTGILCVKHGGTCNPHDASWCCDQCANEGYAPCKCSGNARGFGEALFSSAGCEECDESVSGVGIDARALWNRGIRGWQERQD